MFFKDVIFTLKFCHSLRESCVWGNVCEVQREAGEARVQGMCGGGGGGGALRSGGAFAGLRAPGQPSPARFLLLSVQLQRPPVCSAVFAACHSEAGMKASHAALPKPRLQRNATG